MRYDQIPSELFIINRKKLLSLLADSSVAIVNSADKMPRNGDAFFPFRQHSDMFYLTGINQELSKLVLCVNGDCSQPREILYIVKPNPQQETWEGKKLTLQEASAISGIKTVKYLNEFQPDLNRFCNDAEIIYLNKNENPRYKSSIATADDVFQKKMRKKVPINKIKRLAPLITQLRLIKEPQEIEILSKACNITKQAFLHVLRSIRPSLREHQLEAIIAYDFLLNGASAPAFETIVASGKNACYLHYIKNNDILRYGDMVLLDFGAEYANYSADCSRTIPINGRYSKRQREVYEGCLEVFYYARSLFKPGVSINDCHEKVCQNMEAQLIKLEVFTQDDVRYQRKNKPMYKNYFMHGVSHFLGLDTHDVGDKSLILQPGMVITCEPGIYIREEGLGVRIENDLLITQDGNIDLMQDIPIEANEIEQLLKQR